MANTRIELMQEEVNSLLNGNEICIFEDETNKVFIKLPESKETARMINILERYNNEEYWDEELQ